MTFSTSLSDSAMLATLTISQWSARKYDKSVTAEIERAHQAHDAGRFNKALLPKDALENISKVAGAARAYHYKVTLPWGDNGNRLLPATLFMEYAQEIRKFKQDFENGVHAFVKVYPALCAAARTRLGSLYDANDYPAASELYLRFAIETEFTPVPTAGDFRVNLNKDYVDSIKSDIEQRMNARLTDATRTCWERLREVVTNIHERLSDKDKVFRDTLMSNASELLKILPALNITNDPQLAAMADEVQALLVPPDRLRSDKMLRAKTASRAAEILAKLGV